MVKATAPASIARRTLTVVTAKTTRFAKDSTIVVTMIKATAPAFIALRTLAVVTAKTTRFAKYTTFFATIIESPLSTLITWPS
jgi:hypothetical protein